jgi:hypothetical protein
LREARRRPAEPDVRPASWPSIPERASLAVASKVKEHTWSGRWGKIGERKRERERERQTEIERWRDGESEREMQSSLISPCVFSLLSLFFLSP